MRVDLVFGVINLAAVISLVTTTPTHLANKPAAEESKSDLNRYPKQAVGGLLVPEFRADVTLNVGPSPLTGTLDLTQLNSFSPVRIQGTLTNLPPNTNHGFHVHQMGDIRGGCASTLAHFNPFGKNHGAPTDIFNRHVGDMGNIVADANGQAVVDITDFVISLTGPNSIIGRAFVLHELIDDLGRGGNPASLITGNSGNRLKCGIIGVAA